MGPLMMTLEEVGSIVIGSHTIFIWGASSVEVEYSALVCNHNYSLWVWYRYSYLSRVYLPTSNNPVCSLKVLEGEELQAQVNTWPSRTSQENIDRFQ